MTEAAIRKATVRKVLKHAESPKATRQLKPLCCQSACVFHKQKARAATARPLTKSNCQSVMQRGLIGNT